MISQRDGFVLLTSWFVVSPADLCRSRRRLQQRKGELRNDKWSATVNQEYSGGRVCIFFCSVWQNFVVAVGAEGWFHLFDLTAATASKSDSSSQHELTSSEDQKPLFTQHIPANTKVILISDIGESSLCSLTTRHPTCVLILWIWPHGVLVCSVDGDGRCELVVGYTVRVVRAFRWEEPSDGSDVGTGQLVLLKKWLLEGQVDLRRAIWNPPHSVYCVILANWKFNTRNFV